MSDSLRAEVDRIIDQHFEPSVMGRTLAVDEIMAAINVEVGRLAKVTVDRILAMTAPVEHKVIVSAPQPPPTPLIFEDPRVGRRRSGW